MPAYDLSSLELAVHNVVKGVKSKEVSNSSGIPRSTLLNPSATTVVLAYISNFITRSGVHTRCYLKFVRYSLIQMPEYKKSTLCIKAPG